MRDTGANVPESLLSLLAQQEALRGGRRPAQMFPAGSPELPLPPGMGRLATERGTFHFDPRQIGPMDILRASAAGRENDVLGLGPLSKDDVYAIMAQTGEHPVVVVERDKRGAEVKAALATPSTARMQAAAIEAGKGDGHRVAIEPLLTTLARRGA